MRPQNKFTKEIRLRLKAPIVAMEKIAKGKYLPKVFAKATLDELKIIQRLIKKANPKGN
jgi:hypothetical protein